MAMLETNLRNHETLEKLRAMLSGCSVAGGSFAHWLPDPRTLQKDTRETALRNAREVATNLAISQALQSLGINLTGKIESGLEGERQWPQGLVGSISHKGTLVLVAVSNVQSTRMLGIDLEMVDGRDLSIIRSEIAPEIPNGANADLLTLLTFSGKESVFKAQFPKYRHKLGFSDVRLCWSDDGNSNYSATVNCLIPNIYVKGAHVGKWVVTTAFER